MPWSLRRPIGAITGTLLEFQKSSREWPVLVLVLSSSLLPLVDPMSNDEEYDNLTINDHHAGSDDDFDVLLHPMQHELLSSSLNELSSLDSLGPGFGQTLAEFSDDEEVTNQLEHDEPNDDSIDALNDVEDEHGFATAGSTSRRRRRPRASRRTLGNDASHEIDATDSGDHRLSLACELTTATNLSSSSSRRDRDLLSELGLDEEEDPSGREARSDSSTEYDSEDVTACAAVDVTAPDDSQFGFVERASAREPASPRRRRQPRGSLYGSSTGPTSLSRTPDGASSPLEDREQLEAMQVESMLELESSIRSTTEFLSRLEMFMRTGDAPSSAHNEGSTTSDQTSSRLADRQKWVEDLASRLVKAIHELVRTRERQSRELTEVERALARMDPSWRAALGGLDEIRVDGDAQESLASDLEKRPSNEHDRNAAATLWPGQGERAPATDTGAVHPDYLGTVIASLSALRLDTNSLVNTLTSIHEKTQVHHAATSDSSRKLRAMRAHLTSLADEFETAQRGEEYIERWERAQRLEDGLGMNAETSERHNRWARQARSHARWAEDRLEQDWAKAQSMLGAASRLAVVPVRG